MDAAVGTVMAPVSHASADADTIGNKLRHHARLHADDVAIVSSGYAALSYRELLALIDNIRADLRGLGLGRGARIAVVIPNGPEAALAIVSVACSAVSIPLNPKQSIRETEVFLAALRPDAVLVLRGSDSVVRRGAEHKGIKIIEVIHPKKGSLDFKIDQAGDAAPPDQSGEPDPDATAFIFQTSGTASEPKFIPFSHRNMLAAAARVGSWFDLTSQDRCLSVSPIFYSHGLKVTVFTPLLTGGTVAFPTDASKFDFAEWFGVLRPTWYSAGPTLHRLVFDQTKSREVARVGHSLRFILSGGAPLPSDVREGLQRALDVPVVEHYGSSEAAQIAVNQPPPGHSKPGTCGVPWPGTVMIVDDDGHPLPSGEQGEILVGGPTLTSGYLNAPELNRVSFSDGWFKTGDIGSIDQDGFLTLHGRKNDMINRGGEKISPVEIDDALLRHPAVTEAAAFAVPHARLGQDVAAAVVLRAGMTATPIELRKFLQDQLASFKVPRRIMVSDQLPKGKTGKILRRQLGAVLEARSSEAKAATPLSIDNVAIRTMVAQLTELWERLLQTSPVSIDDDFTEKGGDSLLAMEMLSEVERLTGQTIPSSILFEARTIRQLAQMLFEHNVRPKAIVKLNPTGSLAPILLFHSDYNGGGLYTARLANLLGADQPLFVIAPHDLGREPVPLSVEEIAADRLPLILIAQPKGPYRLCGYCMGGLIAFEVARLLMGAGEKVEIVGMIDSPTVGARPSVNLLISAMRSALPIAPSFVDRVIRRAWYMCLQLDTLLSSKTSKVLQWGSDHRLSMVRAVVNYSPKPLPVPVMYFAAEYCSAAWRRMSSDLETIEIQGNHAEAVRDPANLAKISHHLRARFKAPK